MSELRIRQTSECTKIDFEKASGVHKSSCKLMKKVCDENEAKKYDNLIKNFVVKEGLYKAISEEWQNQFR